MAKRPTDVVGFYIPTDRSTDYTGEVTDPLTGKITRPPTMTKQEFIAECDINNIIKDFTPSAMAALMSQQAALGGYTDLPDPYDLQEAIAIQEQAGRAFDSLPSKVRDRFGNDPGRFLEFFHEPGNRDEAIAMGLIIPPEPPKPVEVIIKGQVPEPPPEPKKPA